MEWNVYLSGEIHTDWREKIINGCKADGLPIIFTSAVTDHDASDSSGDLLGAEDKKFWRDHKSAKVNSMRIKVLIEKCDLAVVGFSETSINSGMQHLMPGIALPLGKPYITLHGEDIIHPLKEVNAAAMAWATTPEQVVEILQYTVAKAKA